MRQAGIFIALALLASGAYQVARASLFITNSQRILGTVYAIEALSGPPKPRQKIPVHVTYEFQGRLQRGETRMPMLGKLTEGDLVPLWVSAGEPGSPVLAEPSALFATPLTLLVCGAVALVLTAMSGQRKG